MHNLALMRHAGPAARAALVATTLLVLPVPAPAGTPAEEAVLIIDPSDRDSLLVGNYYRQARNVPDRNVIFLDPAAPDYATFTQFNLPAVLGALDLQRIDDHIDFIVLPPDGTYRMPAAGLVTDSCFPVDHFASSAVYTMAFVSDEVLGGVASTLANQYHTTTTNVVAFDSTQAWLGGQPSTSSAARQYFIGASLGYNGNLGNSVGEILDMIDRSVAVDGTLPAGTFYFMQTTDAARSEPRHGLFPASVAAITGLGGGAEHLMDVLPTGRHDCLGIMTGWASPNIDGTDMTILPGAFCDHLTSWAATFDIGAQTKLSRWIVNGASGSAGAVEEPCAYPGKFPTPNMHVFYFQGLTLGEAYFRSAAYVPFQILLAGDPLTRPFAYIPQVDIPDAPAGPVGGTIVLTPVASTAHPSAQIATYDLYIDGVAHDTVPVGNAFTLDTTTLADGHHELRVLATDDTPVASAGRWIGGLQVDNLGQALDLVAGATTGTLSSPFEFTITATGGDAEELRLVHGSRVVAATTTNGDTLTIHGWQLGAGPVRVQAEAVLPGRRMLRSAPVELDITDAAATGAGTAPPAAFSYAKKVIRDRPVLVELPAAFDTDFALATYSVVSGPAQATIAPSSPSRPYVLVQPVDGASGTDQLTFEVQTPAGTSNVGTVNLLYGGAPANDDCASAPLVFDGQHAFDTIDAETDGFDEPGGCGDLTGDVWFRYVALCEGLVTISVCDADFDTTLAVYAACPAGPDEALYCNDDACGPQSRISFENPGTAIYRLRIGGAGGEQGFGSLSVTCDPCPADCAPGAGDGTVDTQDLLALLAAWGTAGGPCDFAGGIPAGPDDIVDTQDLLVLLASWGPCP